MTAPPWACGPLVLSALLLSSVFGCGDKPETPEPGDSGTTDTGTTDTGTTDTGDSGITDTQDTGTSDTQDSGWWLDDDDGDGYTPIGGDCDDDDSGLRPGADELPGDDIDQNCDASDAGPVLALDEVDGVWLGVEHGCLAGRSLAIVRDLDGDGLDELLVGAPQSSWNCDDVGGGAYLIAGPAAGEAGLDRADAAWHGGTDFDWFGGAIASAGDPEGGGVGDILIGTPIGNYWGYGGGVVYRADPSGLTLEPLFAGPSGSFTGAALAGEFDANGDGLLDTLVGSPNKGSSPTKPGQADLLLGPLPATLLSPGGSDATLVGEHDFDEAGQSVAAGDLNGDGYDDLIVGAPMGGPEGELEGMAYIMFGPCTGTLALAESGVSIAGDRPGAEAGASVAVVPDLDGDGVEDLAIGAPLDEATGERAGAAFVFYDLRSGSRTVSDADATFAAETTHEWLGISVAGTRAADGSGALLVGAPRDVYATGGYPGKVYLFAPPLVGTLGVGDVALLYSGVHPDETAGVTLSGAGDLNGDGRDDVAIGAPYSQEGVVEDVGGAVYVSHSAW